MSEISSPSKSVRAWADRPIGIETQKKILASSMVFLKGSVHANFP